MDHINLGKSTKEEYNETLAEFFIQIFQVLIFLEFLSLCKLSATCKFRNVKLAVFHETSA